MSLISQLNEASSLSIDNLKKAMQKDPRCAPLFKKGATVDSIPDVEAFLSTVKYWLLNNENVKSFVAGRHNVKDLGSDLLASFRQYRSKDFDQTKLEVMQDFVRDLFKEHGSVSRGTMSSDLKKQLSTWLNSNSGHHDLPPWAERELLSIPTLRPDKRILLYRGILFSEASLKSRTSYDGTLEKGNGLKFLATIRQGGRTVDLKWDRASSWTTSREIADQFAKYGPATSQFAAMTQWLHRGKEGKFIDGALGYVISTFADPTDILVDTARLNTELNSQHGFEGEVILRAGEYLARIVKKYTVTGEVDPSAEATTADSHPVSGAVDEIKKLNAALDTPEQLGFVDASRSFWRSDSPTKLMSDMTLFKKLLLNGTTTAAVHAMDVLLDFYNKHLADLKDEDTRADSTAHSEELTAQALQLKQLISHFTGKVQHSKFKSDKNTTAHGKVHELTGEEYRTTISSHDMKYLEKDLMTGGRISDRNAGHEFSMIAKAVGAQLPTSASIERFGAATQEPVIDDVLKKFFSALGLDEPADRTEAIKSMINLLRKAHRNYVMLQELHRLHDKIGELAGKESVYKY